MALVVGSETTLRDAAVHELREAALGSGPRDFNQDRFGEDVRICCAPLHHSGGRRR